VVEVTTIREVCEFEDLDYLMKMRGLRNWLMLNGLSFSGPVKILFIADCFTTEHRGWGHSYFKHAEAYSKLSSISDTSSHSKPSRPRPP
jgi:hypothetical protein